MRTVRLIALCLTQVAACAALAERGVVKATNGLNYEGDLQETPTQVIIKRNKTEVRVERADVLSLHYLSSDAEEIKKQWNALKMDDAPGRVALAKQAFEHGQYELARSIAADALSIDPNNREAVDLQDYIRRQVVMEIRASRQREDTEEAKRSPYALPECYLDEHDINAVRQSELQSRDEGKVRVRFDNDVRRRFVHQYKYNPTTFAALSAFQQAMTMIREGDAAIRKDVIIFDDPAAIREFRAVQKNVLTGCASQVCHGSFLGGNFILFSNTDNDAVTYTNFYLLTKYSRTAQEQKLQDLFSGSGSRQRMVDRDRPKQSLLLQYALASTIADLPHPQVPNMRPMFTKLNDPVYVRMLTWIDQSLRRVDVQPEVAYISPVEQLLQATTQPVAAPTTRQTRLTTPPAPVLPVSAAAAPKAAPAR